MTFSHVTHPMITQEKHENFTEEDHTTWNILFNRQVSLLRNNAVDMFYTGLSLLELNSKKIPKFSDINKILQDHTQITIIPVRGFIPEELFFSFLQQGKFPATCFIRKPHQLDYLEEPDIFHDVFGHIPLLIHPLFAKLMRAFGRKGLEAMEAGCVEKIAALYWFTIEFGLIQQENQNRLYGAGLLSSKGESVYALESNIPAKKKFCLKDIFNTSYEIDSFQKKYFIIQDFEELLEEVERLTW